MARPRAYGINEMDIVAAAKRILHNIFYRPKYSRRRFGSIGRHTRIGDECALEPQYMYLDDYVVIQNRVNFISSEGRLIVKKYSVISSQCIIIPGTHMPLVGMPFYYQTIDHIGDECSDIIIEEDCWIGAGSILLMKSHIGRGAVVAAGSVVTKPVPPYAVVAGNPARVIGVKFTKEDILKHEEALYSPSERLSAEQIDNLFATFYSKVKPMKLFDCGKIDKVFDKSTEKLVEI